MCGIAGILGLGSELSDTERSLIRGMTEVLRHRGPDHTGYLHERRCYLGNARLNVIDLSHQADLPMANADGSVWIAYNGEVTNFRELRDEYELDEKYPFRSTSDTEVVLHLYEELGIDFVEKLTGMFAFILYDQRLQRAWVVRDCFGIRPLFLMQRPGRLYVASEIKSFLQLPDFDGELDLEGLYHYFSLAYIPGEHTPYRQVRELQGGQLIEVDLRTGATEERSYYEPRYEPDRSITVKNVVEPLYEELKDSVRRNLIADAPLGLTYSGGFDTSTILALARELRPGEDIHTFSIVVDEPSFDESYWQHQMVDKDSPTHHEIRVGPKEVEAALYEHMAFMDEPSGDGAAIPSYLLAREAKKYVTVLLSGEGGDETFNAYETHLASKIRSWYRRYIPGPLRRAAYWTAHRLPTNYKKLSIDFVSKRFTEGVEMPLAEAHIHWRHPMTEVDKRQLIPAAADVPSTGALFQEILDNMDFPDELNRISLLDLKTYFIGDLMVKNDRTMMAHSIEARFPLMDRKLLDFVATIPPEIRIRRLTRRYIQKRAMAGRVPKPILKRQNMGLEMPHSLWFLGPMRKLADHYFSKPVVEKAGFLHYPTVERLWNEHLHHKRDNGRGLWCILKLLVWMELFVYEHSYKRYLVAG